MRNRYLSIIAAAFFMLATGLSCQKKMPVSTVAAYSEFATPLLTSSYFIKNDPSSTFKVPIGITNISNTARKVTIKDSSSTAVAGVQYSIDSSTITIPPGKSVDSFVVKGIYSGYPLGRVDTLYLKITGGDVPLNAYATTYMIIMQGYCDVIQTDLIGDYTNTGDFFGGLPSGQNPYTASIISWTSTGTTSAKIKVTNIGSTSDDGFGPFDPADPAATGITVLLDWTDPSNFTATIPSQPYMQALYTYGPATIAGTGSFSSCGETFTLTYTVSVSAGDFNPITTVLKR